MKEQSNWYSFQEEISDYFKSLGFECETNKTVIGIRTKHDIDIFVKSKFVGQDITWIIEAKKWKSKVNKLQALGLRSIVEDIGADKGFIISEKGFQKGAIEACNKTNITLLTFSELKDKTKDFIENEILSTYEKRLEIINRRYFSHNKNKRIKYGLRAFIGELSYSIPFVIATIEKCIIEAKNKEYPIELNTLLNEKYGNQLAENFQQLINWMNLNLNIIDEKILDAESKMQKNGDFDPFII